ncbi:MAG TPA: hypothetical protein VMS12_09720 [Thermoanaerobaculia bacterium]|nr:hypothetical protein [Thermoanaerobaculia bacterium]
MTIYDGNSQQFQPRASLAVLSLVSASIFVLALVITPLAASALEAGLAAASGWPGPLILHSPPASHAEEIYSYWREDSWLRAGPAVTAAGCAVLGLLLMYFWPTDQKMATRLFVHGLATMLVLFGFVAPGLDDRTATVIPPTLWMILCVSAGAWLLMRFERRTLALLKNLYEVDTPGKRLTIWSARFLPAFALIAILCAFNQYLPGVYASLIGIAATFLETISHQPTRSFERLGNPRMQEAAVTLPILAIGLLAVSIYVFGAAAHPAFQPRALVISAQPSVSIEPLALVRSRYTWHPPKVEPEAPEEPKIDIRWSKPKS